MDIDELMNEEFEKASEENKQWYLNILADSELPHKIILNVIERLYQDGGKHDEVVFRFLLRTLERLPSLNIQQAHFIFDEIQSCLNHNDERSREKGEREEFGMSKIHLKMSAIEYFDRRISSEIKAFDLPQQLKRVKELLLTTSQQSEEFYYKALIEIKTRLENKIVLDRDDLELRKQPALSGADTNEKNEGTLRKRVFALLLLIYGKLEIPNQKEDLRTEIINFVAFITGQNRQRAKEALQNPTSYINGSERSRKSILSDLREVRKHFRALDLKQAKILTMEAKTILDIEAEELEQDEVNQKKS